jgi:hypothetical protein
MLFNLDNLIPSISCANDSMLGERFCCDDNM